MVHEESGIPLGRGSRVGNFHGFGDSLVFQCMNVVDVGAADEGRQGTKVGCDDGIFQILDCCHFDVVVGAKGGTTSLEGEQGDVKQNVLTTSRSH